MKKWIYLIIVTALVCMFFGGCNKQILDLTYNFNKAIIQLPNGEVIEGKVQSWKDYEGDQLQIVIDGTTYLVHSSDAVLIGG